MPRDTAPAISDPPSGALGRQFNLPGRKFIAASLGRPAAVCLFVAAKLLRGRIRRGFRRPPTFHQDRLRDAPVGHVFDVITNGFGAMPDYAAQIKVEDRWAIIAYLRALQLSEHATVADVPADKRSGLDQ